jgi:hypothetical protein
VPLAAAALQFSLAHLVVAAIIPGPRNVEEFHANLKLLRHSIPARLWADLRDAGLLHPRAPTPILTQEAARMRRGRGTIAAVQRSVDREAGHCGRRGSPL